MKIKELFVAAALLLNLPSVAQAIDWGREAAPQGQDQSQTRKIVDGYAADMRTVFARASADAKKAGKPLLFVVGEFHHLKNYRLYSSMALLRAAHNGGIKTFMYEGDATLLLHERAMPFSHRMGSTYYMVPAADQWGMRIVPYDSPDVSSEESLKPSGIAKREAYFEKTLLEQKGHTFMVVGAAHLEFVQKSKKLSRKFHVVSVLPQADAAFTKTLKEDAFFKSRSMFYLSGAVKKIDVPVLVGELARETFLKDLMGADFASFEERLGGSEATAAGIKPFPKLSPEQRAAAQEHFPRMLQESDQGRNYLRRIAASGRLSVVELAKDCQVNEDAYMLLRYAGTSEALSKGGIQWDVAKSWSHEDLDELVVAFIKGAKEGADAYGALKAKNSADRPTGGKEPLPKLQL